MTRKGGESAIKIMKKKKWMKKKTKKKRTTKKKMKEKEKLGDQETDSSESLGDFNKQNRKFS